MHKISTYTLLSLLFCLCSLSMAQSKSAIKAGGFSIPEYNEKGELSCVVKGDHGVIYGKETRLEGVTVEMYQNNSPLILKTPKCTYKMDEKRCTSKEAVKITSDGVKITGVGFDIDNTNQTIFIRSQVKVIWKKKKSEKSLKAETKK